MSDGGPAPPRQDRLPLVGGTATHAPAPSPPDEEPAGRRELVVRTGSGSSVVERVSRLFYRLSWRTPIHGIRLQGRHPLRLLAAPRDPLPANKASGMAIRAGHFRFRGQKIPLDALSASRPGIGADAMEWLHRFDWLRDLDAAAGVEGARSVAEPLVAAWLDRHDKAVGEPVWRADIAAWRMMTMMAHAPAILASRNLVYRSKVLNALARTARHLERSAGKTPAGAERITAWAGVVAAGLLLPEGQGRRLVGEAQLDASLQGAVYPEGGIVSRSPLVLADSIGVLSLLSAAYAARREAVPPFLSDALERMVPALTGLTHGDGGLGAWQGAPALGPERIEAVVSASGVRARPLRQSRDWGYQRVTANGTVLLVDTAPPPLAHQSASGCASTLAFELSHGEERLIVNCGGAAMTGAHVDAALAQGLRSSAAHSTLIVADTNSTAILSGGRLGHGVDTVDIDRQETEGGERLVASHDGYRKPFGLIHRRMLALRRDGLELRGEDVLLPVGGTRRKAPLPIALRFHLGPFVEPETAPAQHGRAILLRLPDGSNWQLRCGAGTLSIEDSLWVDEEGRPRPTRQLVIGAGTEPGGTSIGWQIARLD